MPNIPLPYVFGGSALQGPADIREHDRDSQVTNVINAIRITTSSDRIEEEQVSDNAFNLASQEFPATLLSIKPFTHYKGVAGTVVNRKAIFNNTCIVEGIHFTGEQQRGVLVELKGTAVVIFRDCIFDLVAPGDDDTWVSMESGASAVFSGCVWKGGRTGSIYVDNAGAAANALVVASMATSTSPGGAFVNTTNTAVL